VQSWWGALPDLGWAGIPILLVAGAFIVDRINKAPLVLFFLGAYFALFTGMSFLGNPANVSEIFRAPDLHAVLFFAFFMLDDPPTCPVRYRDQVVFGLIAALACFAIFEAFGWVYFLPAGLVVANACEGVHRVRRQHTATMAAAVRRRQGVTGVTAVPPPLRPNFGSDNDQWRRPSAR
jgi:Na+-translocating ferredoxin:NAD+ oxidoreductase RnfD subunit